MYDFEKFMQIKPTQESTNINTETNNESVANSILDDTDDYIFSSNSQATQNTVNSIKNDTEPKASDVIPEIDFINDDFDIEIDTGSQEDNKQ